MQVLEAVPKFQAVKEVKKNIEAIKDAAAKLEVPVKPVIAQSQLPHAAIVSEVEKITSDRVIMGRAGKTPYPAS